MAATAGPAADNRSHIAVADGDLVVRCIGAVTEISPTTDNASYHRTAADGDRVVRDSAEKTVAAFNTIYCPAVDVDAVACDVAVAALAAENIHFHRSAVDGDAIVCDISGIRVAAIDIAAIVIRISAILRR